VRYFSLENQIDVDMPQDLVLSEVKLELDTPTEANNFLLTELSHPHPSISSVHRVSTYSIVDKAGQAMATVIGHNAPNNFTAANVYQYLWLFPVSSFDIDKLLAFLWAQEQFKDRTIQFVTSTECAEIKTKVQGVPAFWTFTKKEDLGPLVGSIHRAIYTILRKYGEEGLEELSKSFSKT
jgi:hypothetical protein